MEAAELVGEEIAKQCLDKGITMVVFDRGGFRYEGRVKAWRFQALKEAFPASHANRNRAQNPSHMCRG